MDDSEESLEARWMRTVSATSPGTAITVVKKDEPVLVVAPRPVMDGGSRQFGDATLVPHPTGIAPRGPKVLYVRDGKPTYVETLRCPNCNCYFTLTFDDPTTRTKLCVACWRTAKDKTDGITTPVVRTTPVTTPTTPVTTPVTKYGSGYSGYSSYSNYKWIPPTSEFDKFFESLATPVLAKNAADTEETDNEEWKIARHASKKSKAGKKKSKKDKRAERKARKIYPDAF